MKKRLLSFIMCALMLVSAFVMSACGDDEEGLFEQAGSKGIETTSSNKPMTICIYGIKEPGTTDEAILKVEEALNSISVRRYNTTIDLILIEEEEYAAQIFSKVKMAVSKYSTNLLKNNKLTSAEKQEIMKQNVDYYYEDELGKSHPYNVKQATNISSEVLNGTLDIFLVYDPDPDSAVFDPQSEYYNEALTKYSMFDILYREQALAPLKTMLSSGTYAAVKSVVYTDALNYVTRPSYKNEKATDIYGVPNNYIYGDYEYVIFNKNYVDLVYPGVDKSEIVTSLTLDGQTTYPMLDTLIDEIEARKESGAQGFTDLHSVERTFSSYEEYVKLSDDEKRFAIGYVKGNNALETLFESYTNLDVYPMAVNAVKGDKYDRKMCSSMFCVGSPAQDNDNERLKRSMDILLLMNTNTDFRNILQYGVEGVHFSQYSDDEVIPISSDRAEAKYSMNMKYSGNMFLLYPSVNMTAEERAMAANNWQLAKDQVYELLTRAND